MSIPFGSNVLTFSDVARQLRTTFETFADRRRGKNTRYTLVDAALSAFSVFFMQNLSLNMSFLGHQRTMQGKQGKDDAQTLFGVHQAPTDNHIRSLLNAVDPAATSHAVEEAKVVEVIAAGRSWWKIETKNTTRGCIRRWSGSKWWGSS